MMQKTLRTKVLIIGSGPAGYSAAIYAARSALEPILVSGYQIGGQLTITTNVENYPGFGKTIQGPWLMNEMKHQSQNAGVNLVTENINNVKLDKYPFSASDEAGNTYIAYSIIISTGSEAKWLGLKSEKKFIGFGVSGCATCDGFFFKNQKVFVIGGGNTAFEEALYLTNHASQVFLLHRRNEFRSEKILQNKLLKHPKIRILWNCVLEQIIGSEEPLSVNKVKIKNLKTMDVFTMQTSGIFIAIGHRPNTKLFEKKIDIDNQGYIITVPNSTKTSKEGVFAAGDVQDKIYRQAVTAAGTGCMAALDALKFLNHNSYCLY